MGEIPQILQKFKGATREKVRASLVRVIETMELPGAKDRTTTLRESTKLVSITKVRSAGGGDQNCITECLREWRAGRLSLADSWGDPDGPTGSTERSAAGTALAERLRASKTDAERSEVLAEASAQAADGGIPIPLLMALTSACNAARLSDKEARAVEPDEIDAVLPCTQEAVPLIEAFEAITSDVRRKLVMEFATEQLAKDQAEGPQANRVDQEGEA